MNTAPDWQPDVRQSRIFWLQHEHFSLDEGAPPIEFQAYACYDVVAAPGWCIAAPRQPWGELWLIRDGQVDLVQDEKRATVRAGEIALLTGGRSRLSTESRNAPLSLLGFSFGALLWKAIDLLVLLDAPLRIAPDARAKERIEGALQNLVEEARDRRALSTLAARGWAQIALLETLRVAFGERDFQQLWREKIPAALSTEIAAALSFVAAHLDEPLHLETLARHAHLSPKHFARKFKVALGVAPMEYVRRARLERAQGLLAASGESVGQVAARCGFDDAAHFSRAFKEFAGATPLEFRRQARAFSTKISHHNPNG
jgi:AraC-like DNA-binding protein